MVQELLLKTRLLINGIRIDQSAYDGVCEKYKEQVHHLFEYDFDLHTESHYPAEMRLPGGSIVQVRLNKGSSFLVRRQGQDLILEENMKEISTIEWLERPEFYNFKTSTGKPMTSIAELVGEDCIKEMLILFMNN
jgi:hypothetical protein